MYVCLRVTLTTEITHKYTITTGGSLNHVAAKTGTFVYGT